MRAEVLLRTREAVNHCLGTLKNTQKDIDILKNEIRNILVGIWHRYEFNSDEPMVGVDLDPNDKYALRIYPENDTAAFMLWGEDAIRKGATRR